MIITRTPTRIALGGGGTDIPTYYWKRGGAWISGAIDKFVYVSIKPRFEKEIRLSYSALEIVDDIDKIKHPIFREVLKWFDIDRHIEITTMSDIPSGTGLGSSGSFTVGLINALAIYTKQPIVDLADKAFFVERQLLNRSVGKQDQYSAMCGGIKAYGVDKDGRVTYRDLEVHGLDDYLSLFYTKIKRKSESILFEVQGRIELLDEIKEIGSESWDALNEHDFIRYGKLLDRHWEVKRKMSSKITTPQIDSWYKKAKQVGAIGGKVIGAGGGGFMMFCTPDETAKKRLKKTMEGLGLIHMPFKFHPEGSKVIEI